MKERLAFNWARGTFGEESARSQRVRAARILEEAIELAQVCGLTTGDVANVTQQVYAKPAGDLRQEIGGLEVCIASLCGLHGISMDECYEKEFARCLLESKRIAEKNLKKVIQ